MQPNSTPKAGREKIIDALIKQKLWSNRKLTRMVVVGVRGYYHNSMGKQNTNDRGIYDDAFFVMSPDTFTSFNGNVDPSVYKAGRANLVSPQKVVYKPGKHGLSRPDGGYPAFRQASAVVVRRDDGVGNGKSLGNGLYTDQGAKRFWINLHRGGYRTTSSHGCQTVPPNQWDAFYALIRLQMKRFEQSTFNYYLIDGPIR